MRCTPSLILKGYSLKPMTHCKIKSLIDRIAMERSRPAVQQTVQELRRDVQRVIDAGAQIDIVESWLRGLLGDASRGRIL